MSTQRTFYSKNGVLMHFTITRTVEHADYTCIEYHDYCQYRTKSGLEDSTYCSKWEDNRGNYETFIWNNEKNGVDVVDSYARYYIDGVKYPDLKSYREAKTREGPTKTE